MTDASFVGLGAVLMQRQSNNELTPVGYISRSLSPTEGRYSQIEALACLRAVKRFHNYFSYVFYLYLKRGPLGM